MRIPLISGREFNDQDTGSSLHVALINQTMARRYWPGVAPIGKTRGGRTVNTARLAAALLARAALNRSQFRGPRSFADPERGQGKKC